MAPSEQASEQVSRQACLCGVWRVVFDLLLPLQVSVVLMLQKALIRIVIHHVHHWAVTGAKSKLDNDANNVSVESSESAQQQQGEKKKVSCGEVVTSIAELELGRREW